MIIQPLTGFLKNAIAKKLPTFVDFLSLYWISKELWRHNYDFERLNLHSKFVFNDPGKFLVPNSVKILLTKKKKK